jgi:anti-sigma factor RsiW
MKRLCDWFNRHRDGMLDPEQQRQFESHMAVCEECRTRSFLLNSLVRVIKEQELPVLAGRPEQVAAHAYEKCGSWDVLLLSWLRPAPAWSGLALLVILFSFLWILPSAQQSSANSEYEVLMMESDPSNPGGNTPTTLTDDKLERWLEQGGNIQ